MTPRAPGEHPDLPRLVCELAPARPATKNSAGHPAYGRYLLSPIRVLETADPARLRRHAHELLALADALELEHLRGAPGQQTIDTGAA